MSETITDVEKKGLHEIIDAAKAMSEGEFDREVNIRLQGELGNLASFINKTMKNLRKLDPAMIEASEKMPGAAGSLSDIIKTTEAATHKVLSITEKLMDEQEMIFGKVKELRSAASSQAIEGSVILRLAKDIEDLANQNNEDLVQIMTALTFQDITGQRIKKIISLVEDVETRILEILVAFGIKKLEGDKREEIMEQLKGATKSDVLKQDLVDDILKNLGM